MKNCHFETFPLIDDISELVREISDEGRHFASEGQKKNFYCSRKALRLVLESHGINLKNLEITEHLHLKDNPELKVSLSHGRDFCIAAICSEEDVKSIGVDIENSARVVKTGIEKFYINDRDTKLRSSLEIWCIKEAAFKAVSPLLHKDSDSKPLILKEIEVLNDSQFIVSKDGQEFEGLYELTESKPQLISLAFV